MTKEKIKEYLIFTVIAVIVTVFFLTLGQSDKNQAEFEKITDEQNVGN